MIGNKSVLALMALMTVAVAQAAVVRDIDSSLDEQWRVFKLTFNKQYSGPLEAIRRVIWEENVRQIQLHNLEYDLGKHTFSRGINQFTDMRADEVKAAMNGLRVPLRPRSNNNNNNNGGIFMAPMNSAPLPTSVDWRNSGYVTPVKDQGACGSCWAFSTTGSIEGQFFRKTRNLTSFSEQQLVDCSGHYGDHGCQGGFMDYAFDYVEKFGIERESAYPYHARESFCRYQPTSVVTRVSGHIDIKRGSEEDLMAAVATVGPVSVAIDASWNTFHSYRGGVYVEPRCSTSRLDHGVLVVGYGEENNLKYWIVKNSWSATWGDQGYIKMARGRGNQCGIATMASYPLL